MHPDRERGTRRVWQRIQPHPRRHVPPPRDGASVEQVRLRLVETAARALPFGAKPQPVAILTDPAPGIPTEAAQAISGLPLELIEQHEVVHGVVVHRVPRDIREGRRPIGIGERRDERRQLDGRWAGGRRLVRGVVLGGRGRGRRGRCLRRAMLVRSGRRLRLCRQWAAQHQPGHETSKHGPHDCRPSSTRTSRNIPASIWNSRWQ